jgi:hypothetical protein
VNLVSAAVALVKLHFGEGHVVVASRLGDAVADFV